MCDAFSRLLPAAVTCPCYGVLCSTGGTCTSSSEPKSPLCQPPVYAEHTLQFSAQLMASRFEVGPTCQPALRQTPSAPPPPCACHPLHPPPPRQGRPPPLLDEGIQKGMGSMWTSGADHLLTVLNKITMPNFTLMFTTCKLPCCGVLCASTTTAGHQSAAAHAWQR